MLKETLINDLREGTVSLNFTKKDGTVREMVATLNEKLIPEDKRPKGTGTAQPVDSPIVRAYDLEIGEFRSINAESATILSKTFA